jgi:transcriptional regulator with XRE-family HTH domain
MARRLIERLPTPPSLSAAIAAKRREVRASMRDLGQLAGVSRQAILLAERAESNGVSFHVAAKIAHALGVPFEVISASLKEALETAEHEMERFAPRRARCA